ncbi:MAG: RND family transporter [Rhodospirillales bacterium]
MTAAAPSSVLARVVTGRRWLAVALSLVLVAATAIGARGLGFATDFTVFFGKDNPQLASFQALEAVYARDDDLLIVVKARAGTVYTPATVAAIRELTAQAWKLPHVTRVDSLTNYQHSAADGDELAVEALAPETGPIDAAMVARMRSVVREEPMLRGRLVSHDETATGVNVTLTLPVGSADAVPETVAAARRLADDFAAAHPEYEVALTGLTALSQALTDATMADLTVLTPLMYGVLALMLLLLLRSVAAAVGVLAVSLLAIAAAMGAGGWMGVALTPPSALAPSAVMTLAIASAIHMVTATFDSRRRGAAPIAAAREALAVNGGTVANCHLTTAIGFLGLNASDAPPFHDLGNMAAAGSVAALVLTVVFLPAFLALVPMRVPATRRQRGWQRLAALVARRRKPIMWATALLVAGSAALVTRIELDDDFVRYLDRHDPFRIDTEFALRNLTGIYHLDVPLAAGQDGGIAEPAYLRRVDGFAEWLRAQPEVMHVYAITDVMKRLNRNMHGDDPAWFRIPDDRTFAAQMLLLYEMSLPQGLDLNDRVDIGKSASRVTATLRDLTARQFRDFEARTRGWLAANWSGRPAPEPTGVFAMFAHIAERNIEGMVTGTGTAFLLIGLCMTIGLRSFRYGLLSMIPNVFPALLAFGLWSLLVGRVGVAAAAVASVTLGIIVDDTVHFLSGYLRARRVHGLAPPAAVAEVMSHAGRPILISTVVLVSGFAVLAASTFELNAVLGVLSAITIAIALGGDLLFLPALLLTIDQKVFHAKALRGALAPTS